MGEQDKHFRKSVLQGFQNAKNDINNLQVRVLLLEAENRKLQEALREAQKEPENQKISESQENLSKEELRLFIKEVVTEAVSEELKRQNTKAASVFSAETATPIEETSNQYIEEAPITQRPLRTPQRAPQDKLKEDLLKNYERNRKTIIKQQILAEANKKQLTKIELREIVVGDKKYCSKASFYRYVEELELEGFLEYKRKNHKTLVVPQISTRESA